MTPDEARRALEHFAGAVEMEAEGALADGLAAALLEAQALSSGMETGIDHYRKDHPYARRHGQIKRPNDPVIVNFQTGAFLQAWRTEGPSPAGGGGLSGVVFNTDPKAGWLHHGTRKMLGRPVPEHAAAKGEAAVLEALERRLRRWF